MTQLLYLDDHYLKEFDAKVTRVPTEKSIVLDKTALYPRGGGQPSDKGTITVKDGPKLNVIESQKEQNEVEHILDTSIPPNLETEIIGQTVHGLIDWDLRYKHMRYHTALHILSGVVFQKLGARITGGQIYSDRARLDFSLNDLNKDKARMIEDETNKIVQENLAVKTFWLSTEEALQKKDLYRLSADLLPRGLERLRIVEIVGFDAQLDGGTHVARTSEVGSVKMTKTENKGKDNKRIEIILV